MTYEQWQELARTLHARQDRIRSMMDKEIRDTARRAGIDPNIYPIHAHNAMCAFESGRPWPEVNYKLLRRVLWLEERQYIPYRLVDSILARAWKKVQR